MSLFVFDRSIDASEFCNFKREREKLFGHLQNGQCVKLIAPRNFGKTSLIKNLVSHDWLELDPDRRIILYVEFYSVRSLDDISVKLTQALNKALSQKRSIGQMLAQIAKVLKSVRPTWKPPVDEGSFGEFSIQTDGGSKVLHFEEVLNQIQKLQDAGTMEFLLIFDEFQEVAHIAQAEALLRDSLQKLSPQLPVVICGSKEHLLQKIFNEPRRPFYRWGQTVELKQIPEEEYSEYVNGKFEKVGLQMSFDACSFLQKKLNHVPEQMNRVCDFAASHFGRLDQFVIGRSDIDSLLEQFVTDSDALYSLQYAQLSKTERAVVLAIVWFGKIEKVNSSHFLAMVPSLTAASVSRIVLRLLDSGVLQRFHMDHKMYVRVEDPLLGLYIEQSGALLTLPTTTKTFE